MNTIAGNQAGTARFSPAVLWAAAGLAILVFQIYVYGAWMISGQAVPVTPGTDPVPALTHYGIMAFQATNVALGIWAAFSLIRGYRANGKLSPFQLLMLGWLMTYWQDPWLSALHPIFIYNANVFNMGCWCEFLPGWSTPNGSRIPEPLLLNIPAYLLLLPSATLPGLSAIRKLVVRVPDAGPGKRYIAAFFGVLLFWVPLELFATRVIHVDIWPGSIQWMSLWPGKFYQIPLYEFVFFPAILAGCSMLLYSAEGDKPSFIEAGVASSSDSPKVRGFVRLFAFVAYANLMNAIYIGLMVLTSLVADPWPPAPSWLRGEVCGDGPGVVCDGPWNGSSAPASGDSAH